jgi:hypothetical protein
MNHKRKSVYTVAEKDALQYPYYPIPIDKTIEIWAEIIKPVTNPEFAGECESKIAKFKAKLPVNLQKLQLAIDKAAPGYELMTWWIPESEDEF